MMSEKTEESGSGCESELTQDQLDEAGEGMYVEPICVQELPDGALLMLMDNSELLITLRDPHDTGNYRELLCIPVGSGRKGLEKLIHSANHMLVHLN